MYIATDSIEHIVDSVEKATNRPHLTLVQFKRRVEREYYYNQYLHTDKVYDEILKLLSENGSRPINQVCMHHLTRRLNSAQNDRDCQNLYVQLTTSSALRSFLDGFGYHFVKGENGLDMVKEGKRLAFDTDDPCSARIRVRLGNCAEKYRDYCVNGFAFADRIEKNNYFRSLSTAPEFICDIAQYFSDKPMLEEYYASSTYYLYTYVLPFDSVIIENEEHKDTQWKIARIFWECLVRIEEWATHNPYCFDHDNCLMRISEYSSLTEKEFLCRKALSV